MSTKEQRIQIDSVAAEAIDQYEGVELDASNPPKVQLPASAGNEPFGIVVNEPTGDGEPASVVVHGLTRLIAGGSISQGDWVQLDANGHGLTAASADYVIGRALEDASSGDAFEIFVAMQVDDKD